MSDVTEGAPPAGGAPQDLLDRVLTVLNTIGSVWIFVLMVLIDTDAFSRTLFAHPFHGVNELVEMSIVGIVFMQLGDATRRGRLTRSDGFYNLVQARAPKAGHTMGAIFDLLAVLFFVIVLFGAIPELYDSWRFNYFVGEEGLFTVAEWPIKTIIVLGCTVTMLQFVKMATRHLLPLFRHAR
ncbi:MAG: TRAP transporter small permease [Alphaproteobacteria bacterium]|nr:TRAP transporter small permease [Alphaproteobacteria bacterium]